MKIDFHTKYSKEHFEPLCERAIKLGLDALVMSGLEENKDINYKDLLIFPAQEVEWKAALEFPYYQSHEDYKKNKKQLKSRMYDGKALILLPSNISFLKRPDQRLFQLLEQTSELGGISISLHDDDNRTIVIFKEEGQRVYNFNGVRIRDGNHDISSKTMFSFPVVAGSGANCAEDFEGKSAFTEYNKEIRSKEELISAIRSKAPNRLLAYGYKEGAIDIRDTIGLRFNTGDYLKKIGFN